MQWLEEEDYCTNVAAVTPTDIATPLWRDFLDRITADEADLQCYLQRMAGYCMTAVSLRRAV